MELPFSEELFESRDLLSINHHLSAIKSMLTLFYKMAENGTLNMINSISSVWTLTSEADYRTLSDSEAKKKIASLLLGRDYLYPSEISMELKIPYSQTLRIIEDLETEGAISFE